MSEKMEPEVILKAGNAIHSEVDRDCLLSEAIGAIVEALKASGGSIMLVDEESQELTIVASKELSGDILRSARRKLGEGIAGWVAKTGEPLLLKGGIQDARFQGVNSAITGSITVPIKLKDWVLGVVNVKTLGEAREFSQSDLETLKAISDELAVAIERSNLFREVEQQARQSLALYELARATCRVQPDEVINVVIEMVGTQMETEQLLAVEVNEKEEALHYSGRRGLTGIVPGEPVISQEERDLFARAMQEVDPRLVQASELDKISWARQGAASFLIGRLSNDEHALGVLVVSRPEGRPFGRDEVDLFVELCNQVAMALQSARHAAELEETAVRQERNRIAQEIHDGLSQSMTGLVLELEGARRMLKTKPEVVDAQMEKAINRARTVLGEVRNYMTSLRTASVTDVTPVELVKKAIEDFRKTTTISVELLVNGAERSVPAAVARALLRITQESLTNVRRHSNATKVVVTLTFREDGVELRTADNGMGFDVEGVVDKAYVSGRFGIVGMRERSDTLGGTFDLQSKPDEGTVVTVWLPATAPKRQG